MRDAWISGEEALRERMTDPAQGSDAAPAPSLPDYAVAFLAHLRLLVGVPFVYLVPDPRMLPNESIRFFHLDRSWADRLVDGTIAVGKIGTREQAHHQSSAPAIAAQLDDLEPGVRPLQRGLAGLDQAPATAEADAGQPISGFLLRSALVSGWPHMEIRGYRDSVKLTLLRLERLSTSVLIALFAGIADRIELEEPHHGIQFGVRTSEGQLVVSRRRADGTESPASDTPAPAGPSAETGVPTIPVALRDPDLRVVEIAALRRLLSYEADQRDPLRPDPDNPGHTLGMPAQTGSAAFATEVLQPPFLRIYADEGQSSEPGRVEMSAAPSIAALSVDLDAEGLAARLRRSR
jgi:hypothetical protein